MYNIPERKKELQEQNDCLETYTQNIKDVLYSHGIKTKSQIDILRKECEATLSRHDKKYSVVNNKVFDMLVGVPLGALISSLIYKSKNYDTIIAAILTLVILGGMFILLSSVIKKLTYYSDGYFKDQYLLNALNELEYCILPDENT